MHQFLIKYFGSQARGAGERKREHQVCIARFWQHLAAVAWGAVSVSAFAVDADVVLPEGRNPVVQKYLVTQVEKDSPQSGNRLATIEYASGLAAAPFFAASESTQCREKPYRFCRDLAQSEFRLTSLRFMVPEVPGLSPKSLSIRRNSVVANYTFR